MFLSLFISFRALQKNEGGSVVVLVALMMVVLMGLAAFGVDAMHAYTTHEKLRKAAEAAATAAVYALPDAEEAHRLAVLFGERNRPEIAGGVVVSEDEVEVGYWDQSSRTFTRDPSNQPLNAVRTTASLTSAKGNPFPTWFGGLIGTKEFDISVAAIAVLQERKAPCILTLHPSASKALHLDSNARIDAPECEVHSTSTASDSLYTDSNAIIESARTCVAGGYRSNSNSSVSPAPETSCKTADDPFADIASPAYAGCDYINRVLDDKVATLYPGVYCGGLTIDGNSSVVFAPGIYVIKNGRFTIDSNSRAVGVGVGFLLTGNGAVLDFNSNTTVSFTAAESGALAGFIFYQDRNFGGMHKFDSNTVAKLDGAIYLPSGSLKADSNATWGAASDCLVVVVDQLYLDSNATFKLNGDYDDCPLGDRLYRKRSKVVA